MPVGRILTSQPQAIADPRTGRCIAGQTWQWDGVVFEMLHPGKTDRVLTDNNLSCVLKITGVGGSTLLTGDIETEAEAMLIARKGADLAADILQVPHHGSTSSSSAAFLDTVDADIAIVSAGYRNRWGFPKPQVLARYRVRDIEVLETTCNGAITLAVTATGIRVKERFRPDRGRYWHHQCESGG